MLNDFVTGNLKCDRAQRIIPSLRRLIETAREYDIPVIYANDAHRLIDYEVVKKWGSHAIEGTKGAAVIPELKPAQKDFIVPKRTYSGFFETDLDSLLRSLYNHQGVDTIVMTGLHTHMCVRHTSADAFFRGYKIIVPEDGVDAFTEEDHKQGLKYFENYAVEVTTVDNLIKKWKDEMNG
jgi:nicotinamidase-related amidase